MIYGADLPEDFTLRDLPEHLQMHEYELTPEQAAHFQELIDYRTRRVWPAPDRDGHYRVTETTFKPSPRYCPNCRYKLN